MRRALFARVAQPIVDRVDPVVDRGWAEDLRAVLLAAMPDDPLDEEETLAALRRFRTTELLRIGLNDLAGALEADAVHRAFVGQTVAEMEQALILDTLVHCLGNRTHAANILGISIRTLRNKLNAYAGLCAPIPAPPRRLSAHAA